MSMSDDNGRITVLRTRREGLPPWKTQEARDEIEAELCRHLHDLREVMYRLGHGSVSALELRVGNQAYDCQVVYRWDDR